MGRKRLYALRQKSLRLHFFEIHASRKNDSHDYAFEGLSPNGKRPGNIADVVHYPLIGDPEGGAQDVRRFSMRQDASSKNPGFASDCSLELDLSVFFGDFLFKKKVTRAPARKRCQALPAHHEVPTSTAPKTPSRDNNNIVQEHRRRPCTEQSTLIRQTPKPVSVPAGTANTV